MWDACRPFLFSLPLLDAENMKLLADCLQRIRILDTLMPPPVLPAHAPINISSTRIVREISGQVLNLLLHIRLL